MVKVKVLFRLFSVIYFCSSGSWFYNIPKERDGSIVQVGIIGGSGFYKLDALKNSVEKTVKTPFGDPSDSLFIGTISDVDCVVLARCVEFIIYFIPKNNIEIISSIGMVEIMELCQQMSIIGQIYGL